MYIIIQYIEYINRFSIFTDAVTEFNIETLHRKFQTFAQKNT